jgi:hypothetical protein
MPKWCRSLMEVVTTGAQKGAYLTPNLFLSDLPSSSDKQPTANAVN